MGCGSSSASDVKNTKIDLKKLQKNTGLPMKFIKEKLEQFQKLDGDGKITKSQFVDVFVDDGDDDMKQFAQQMFRAFDTDKSDQMDFNELITMLGIMVKGSTPDRLRAVFNICDEDRSGKIEKEEFVHTFKNLTFLVKDDDVTKDTMGELAEKAFNEVDIDNNGHIHMDEYLHAFTSNEGVEKMIKAVFAGAVGALVKH